MHKTQNIEYNAYSTYFKTNRIYRKSGQISIAACDFFSLSCFSHKPKKLWDKFRAKTFLGENIGPDAKVLVPDVKVLVPGCGSTGPRMCKYWPLMCQIVPGNAAVKLRDIFEKMKAYG
jgi:hypothetical protein